MNESDILIALAKKQNMVLSEIYNNISESHFNSRLRFSNIDASTLNDFFVYTTGFLCLQNYENTNMVYSDEVIINMLDGKFSLKQLTSEECEKVLRDAGKTLQKRGYSDMTELYTIRDGQYSLARNINPYITRRFFGNQILLTTNPLKALVRESHSYLKDDHQFLFKCIRNALAHQVPIIQNDEILLPTGASNVVGFVFSPMWLRGLAETFSLAGTKVDCKKIERKLFEVLPAANNELKTEADVQSALSLIKSLFSEDIVKNYFRLNNFISNRLKYQQTFFDMSFRQKVIALSKIISTNPEFFEKPQSSFNPQIIYNIQQLIARELNRRGVYIVTKEIKDLMDRHEQLLTEMDGLNYELEQFSKGPLLPVSIGKKKLDYFHKRMNTLFREEKTVREDIDKRRKMETSNLFFYDIDGIEYLPAEMGVNIVLLMAYNNLVINSFYQDTLSQIDLMNMNSEQNRLFSKFNLSPFVCKFNGEKFIPKNPEDIAQIITAIRHSLCHAMFSYTFPPLKKLQKATFKDVQITFDTDIYNTSITGTVDEFFKLFSNPAFTMTRTPEMFTTSPIEVSDTKSTIKEFVDLFEKLEMEEYNNTHKGNGAPKSEKPKQKQPNDDE